MAAFSRIKAAVLLVFEVVTIAINVLITLIRGIIPILSFPVDGGGVVDVVAAVDVAAAVMPTLLLHD